MKIQIGKDYKIVQRESTEKEIERMISEGIEKVGLQDIKEMLANIGLKLDLNENSYLLLYYNTGNEIHYFSATTSPIDEKGISVYNVNSEFYNRELKGMHTDKGNKLFRIRRDYFCTYKKRGIEYILCF